MSDTPRALVITAAGINCEEELARAFALAGAAPELVHLNTLMKQPERVDDYPLIGLPGGFSYGDAVAAGRVMAALMRRHLYRPLVRAIERGVPIIAPCNGFQIAVQMGLLPGPPAGAPWPEQPPTPSVSLAPNASARYVDRWCRIEVPPNTRCIWTRDLELSEANAMIPVAHGEGRFTTRDDEQLNELEQAGQIALRYAADDNPNGSAGDVAGLCDASGLVLGLMPHPERGTRWTQHPFWTRLSESQQREAPLGLQMFRRAVAHAATAVEV